MRRIVEGMISVCPRLHEAVDFDARRMLTSVVYFHLVDGKEPPSWQRDCPLHAERGVSLCSSLGDAFFPPPFRAAVEVWKGRHTKAVDECRDAWNDLPGVGEGDALLRFLVDDSSPPLLPRLLLRTAYRLILPTLLMKVEQLNAAQRRSGA